MLNVPEGTPITILYYKEQSQQIAELEYENGLMKQALRNWQRDYKALYNKHLELRQAVLDLKRSVDA